MLGRYSQRKRKEMKNLYFRNCAIALAFAFSVTLMAGCQPAANRTATDQSSALAKHAAAPQRVPLGQRLSEGMAYADMRSLVLGEGWKPVADPLCTANVVGSDYQAICSTNPAMDACTICKKLPELGSCSGDAYCGMHFSKGRQRLHVVAYGDIRGWNVSGDRSEFTVSGWDFATK
jgi:hypothetical protein